MRIIILGAGQVGATLAEQLSGEANDITVVDADVTRLRLLQDRLDIRTVEGCASFPDVLSQAGCADADMLVAVTNIDEVNMLACQMAQTLFSIPRKVARVRGGSYLGHADQLFRPGAIPVDVLISPEQLITDHVEQLTRWPGTLQVHDFVGGRVKLAVFRVGPESPLCGHRLAEINSILPEPDVRLVAVYRDENPVRLQGLAELKTGDEVYLIATPENLERVTQLFVGKRQRYRQIMIAGGGNIGAALAARLESSFHVKVIETRKARCQEIARQLDSAVVINGSVSELDIMTGEGVEDIDLFCALTNDDEANIMSSMLAKRAGARRVLTIINNPAYVGLVDGNIIDHAISPEQITVGSLLTHIRKGDVARVHVLRQGQAEALETVVHGDASSSGVIGRLVGELKLPTDTQIGAIVRGNRVLMGSADTRIESEDHLIFFMTSRRSLKQVEKMLQVGLGCF